LSKIGLVVKREGVTLTMAKLAPSAFTLAQSTLPCQPDVSRPSGLDLLSMFEGLALTRPRIDAKMRVEHFMMDFVEMVRKGVLVGR
jgi:hypothetical protein